MTDKERNCCHASEREAPEKARPASICRWPDASARTTEIPRRTPGIRVGQRLAHNSSRIPMLQA
eukprot:3331917-Alexandrium_andersonii.AAC.1